MYVGNTILRSLPVELLSGSIIQIIVPIISTNTFEYIKLDNRLCQN